MAIHKMYRIQLNILRNTWGSQNETRLKSTDLFACYMPVFLADVTSVKMAALFLLDIHNPFIGFRTLELGLGYGLCID